MTHRQSGHSREDLVRWGGGGARDWAPATIYTDTNVGINVSPCRTLRCGKDIHIFIIQA
jgi:hypothetical protein